MWFINFFHLQILVVELLLCLHLERRKNFFLRLLPCTVVYCLLPLWIPGGFFASFFTWGWFTFGFLVMFVLSGLLLGFCFRMNVRQVIFYCCVAHTIQHAVHCMYRLTEMIFGLSNETAQVLQLVYMIIACLLVWRLLSDRFRGTETADFNNLYLIFFASVSTLIIYVFSYWASYVDKDTVGMQFFDFFTCVLLLVILLDLFRIRTAEREQMIMERLLRQEQEQHQLSLATVDVINRKCHDLRHQISALRFMDSEERDKSIEELKKAVLIYDSFPKSGNEDVDIILAEKSLLAEQRHVSIRGIVDGLRLSFLKVEDLYSLLGNALDNAIEAASREEEEGRRIVTLHVAARGNLVSVHVENPCLREPVFENGLPVTDKPDRDYHGYGMLSMRYLCEKYHGTLSCGWEDGISTLDILFPVTEPLASF